MTDRTPFVPIRPQWVLAAANEIQAAAGRVLDETADVFGAIAALAERLGPPQTALERIFAACLLQRTAWELLRHRPDQGTASYDDVCGQFEEIVKVTERGDWAALRRSAPRSPDSPPPSNQAIRIRKYVEMHAREDLTLATIARAVGTSVRSATEEFRKCYGLSIREYVTGRRLADALRLLVTTDLKISAVATTVGFQDKASLYRNFSRRLGVTPDRIRREPEIIPTVKARLARSWPVFGSSHLNDVGR